MKGAHGKQERAFGDIRALLQRPPSVKSWSKLCKLVGVFEQDRWTEQLHPYIAGHLRAWPDYLRVTPAAWAKKITRGQPVPHASMCTHLDLSGRDITAASVAHVEDSAVMARHLRVLTLNNAWSTPDALQRLYTSPILAHIDHAYLSIKELTTTSDLYTSSSMLDSQMVDMNFHALAKHLSLKTLMGLHVYEDFGQPTYLKGAHAQLEALHIKLQHNTIPQALGHADLPNLHTLGLSLYQGWRASAVMESKLEALIHAPCVPRVKRLYLMSFTPELWSVLKRAPWDALEHICVVHFSRHNVNDTQGFHAFSTMHRDALRAFAPGAHVSVLKDIPPTLTWPAMMAKTPELAP